MTYHDKNKATSDVPLRRYKRGYDTNHLPVWLVKWLKEQEKSNLLISMIEAVLTVATIPIIFTLYAVSVYTARKFVISDLQMAAIFIVGYCLAAVLIARQQRGLELMVHDASHKSWYSVDAKINNMLADLLVAYPVLSSVSVYWKSHRIHHGKYGSHRDPCRQRFDDMGLAELDLSTKWKITCAVIKWIYPYNLAYYEEIGSLSLTQWGAFICWHLVVMIIPSSFAAHVFLEVGIVQSIAIGFSGWLMFWMLPFTFFLPVLRSIAESEEHDYENGDTEFDTTFTNIGLIHTLLIHPKNDAFHLVHHMFPMIPERRHRRVHKMLMKHDPKYQVALQRTIILGS